MKNKKRFAEMMSTLAVLFDKDMSEVLRQIYWKVLSQYSDEDVEMAFNQVIANCKFFPKPAEIIKFITTKEIEQNQVNALEAWGMVMSGLEMDRVPDYYSIQQAIRRVGGWDYLKGKTYDDLHWIEKRFIEHFEQIERIDEHERLCQGAETELLGLVKKLPEIN